MEEYIFVYGTLMRHFDTQMTRFLNANATYVGEAWVTGLLYDLGHYPGFVYDTGVKSKVYGQVFSIATSTGDVLKVLDEYEAVGERFEVHNEYKRLSILVSIDNEVYNCWCYVYNLPTANLPIIASGDYVAYAKEQPNHQAFLKTV